MSGQPTLFEDAEPRKRKRAQPKSKYERELFQALCDACGWQVKHLSVTSRGRVNVAVKSLKEVDPKPTPEQVVRVGRAIGAKWPDCELTPSSIDANWPHFVKATPARTIQPGAPSRKEVAEREREEEQWRQRDALDAEENNGNSGTC